tara:strand:+ start:117 stop:1769 length:1653 start_codon:yes stop_codon:yes gene_type:complete
MAYNKQDHDDYIKNEQAFFEWKQKIYQINRKLNQEQDHQMKQQRRMQMVMTRSLGGGGLLGQGMSMIQNLASLKQQNYQMLKQLKQKEKTDILSPIEAKQRNMLAGNTTSNNVFSKLDKTFDKFFGGDSKWNKMFGGQGKTAAAGIGLGAAAGGLALGKAIIDSSPLLQQMLKLMKFGFMLILKPIGDFFGMLMRPILILLLRKFIIPFYQTVYPWFAKEGTKLGNNIAKVVDLFTDETMWAIAAGAIVSAILVAIKAGKWFTDSFYNKIGAAVAKGMGVVPKPPVIKTTPATTPTTTTPKATGVNPTSNIQPKASVSPTANLKFQQNQTGKAGSTTTVNQPNPRSNISSGTASTYSKNPAVKNVQKFFDRIQDIWKRKPDMSINNIKSQVSSFMSKQKGNIGGVMDNIKAAASSGQFWSKVGNLGKNILSGKGAGLWGALEPLMYSMFPNMDQSKWQQPDENGDFPMARGGMINERVDGIGRTSGKSYTIGEAGSEMVVPMSKMGKMGGGGSTTVNINISNMSGDANDLNKLRSTILEVMQTVNVNRGR